MAEDGNFLNAEESALAERFLDDGHVVVPVEDRSGLDRLRGAIVVLAAGHLGVSKPLDAGEFLDAIHGRIGIAELNDLRLAVISGLVSLPWARRTYFELARTTLEGLVGNELAMQRRINLSIQLPGDESSLLPVHADVWNGDSPFEVVLWLALVDCHHSKGMFLLPPAANARHQTELAAYQEQGPDALYAAIEPDLIWPEVRYGQALVFSQNLMHGNIVNAEATTRWSLNCRFKGLFSPYADKRLGEFFEPITLRPASRLGLDYELPGDFDE